MAGRDTGLAAGAAIQRNLESILFFGTGTAEWDQSPVVFREIRSPVVDLGKAGHRSLQGALLIEKPVDESPWGGSVFRLCDAKACEGWEALEGG